MSENAPPQAPETPLAYRVVRGGLWVAASSYFNIGFGFLANLALTRILLPEDFGVFALASFFFALLNIRPKTGIGQALAQRKEITGGLVGSHLTLDVTAGAATLVLALAAMPVLRTLGYSWDVALVLLALACVGISDSFMGTAWTLLDKELHFGQTSIASSVAFPLSYIPGFWLAFHGGGYWSLVVQNGCYAILLLVGMWWTARRRLPAIWQVRWHFDRTVATGLLRFGGTVGIATMAGLLVGQFDTFLVGSFVSLATLGFYDRAYRIAQWPSQLVSGVITRTAFYTYARLQDDKVRLQRTVTMTIWLITTLALPIAVAIFVAAPDLVRLLYGDRWLASALFLRFLVIYSVMRPMLDDAHSLFIAVGRPRLTVAVLVAEALTLVAAGTPLTFQFGAVGTAVAVGLTFVVGLVLTYRYVVQVISIRIWSNLGPPAIAVVITLVGYVLLNRFVDLNSLALELRVAAKVAYAVFVFFAVSLALRPGETIGRAADVYRLIRGRAVPSKLAGPAN